MAERPPLKPGEPMVRPLSLPIALGALLLATVAHAQEPGPPAAAPELPQPTVEFEADTLTYDENGEDRKSVV